MTEHQAKEAGFVVAVTNGGVQALFPDHIMMNGTNVQISSTNITIKPITPMFSRAFYINGKKFTSHLKQLVTQEKGESDQELLLRYFKQQHIDMEDPASLILDETANKLIVHATVDDLDKIENVVAKEFQ